MDRQGLFHVVMRSGILLALGLATSLLLPIAWSAGGADNSVLLDSIQQSMLDSIPSPARPGAFSIWLAILVASEMLLVASAVSLLNCAGTSMNSVVHTICGICWLGFALLCVATFGLALNPATAELGWHLAPHVFSIVLIGELPCSLTGVGAGVALGFWMLSLRYSSP